MALCHLIFQYGLLFLGSPWWDQIFGWSVWWTSSYHPQELDVQTSGTSFLIFYLPGFQIVNSRYMSDIRMSLCCVQQWTGVAWNWCLASKVFDCCSCTRCNSCWVQQVCLSGRWLLHLCLTILCKLPKIEVFWNIWKFCHQVRHCHRQPHSSPAAAFTDLAAGSSAPSEAFDGSIDLGSMDCAKIMEFVYVSRREKKVSEALFRSSYYLKKLLLDRGKTV